MGTARFFDGLGAEAIAALYAAGAELEAGKGAQIVAHSDDGRDVYFVLEGRAMVSIYAEDGKVVAYRTLGQGDIFGELSAIDGDPRSASVEALSDVRMLRLTHRAFNDLIDGKGEIARRLILHLVAQSRAMTARIFEFSTMDARRRLIAELLRLAEVQTGPAAIAPAPTHHDLAARISSHREAVSREMSRLARLDLVKKSGGVLRIADVSALKGVLADL